jgi:SARP family transcriptional regulator, regulator of embCAB operon
MLRIYLTGEICLTKDGKLLRADRLPGRQGRLVFAHLACERTRPVSRDELADSLWPRSLPAASEVALSAIVSKLRALFAEVGLGRETLAATSGGYRLALPADSWIDIEVALESVHLAEAALQSGSPRAAYGPAVVACAILRRPFLSGEEGAWIDRRRESLRKNLLRSLDCLAQIHSATGELPLALRAAEEAVRLEPLREAGYRRLMLVHDAAGNRAQALRVFEQLTEVLQLELRTVPGPETRRVYEGVAGGAERKP